MRFVTLNTWGMRGDWAARLPVFSRRPPGKLLGRAGLCGQEG